MIKTIEKVILYSVATVLLIAMAWGYSHMTPMQQQTMMYYF